MADPADGGLPLWVSFSQKRFPADGAANLQETAGGRQARSGSGGGFGLRWLEATRHFQNSSQLLGSIAEETQQCPVGPSARAGGHLKSATTTAEDATHTSPHQTPVRARRTPLSREGSRDGQPTAQVIPAHHGAGPTAGAVTSEILTLLGSQMSKKNPSFFGKPVSDAALFPGMSLAHRCVLKIKSSARTEVGLMLPSKTFPTRPGMSSERAPR